MGGMLKFDDLLGDKSSAWTGLLDKAKESVIPAGLKDKLVRRYSGGSQWIDFKNS